MAIIGVRRSSKPRESASGLRTELRWLTNDGTSTIESTQQVANGNKSTSVLGQALAPTGNRALARAISLGANTLVDEAPL